MPWVLAAAAVSAGGALLSSSNASDAAQTAGNDQLAATQASIAEQARQFDTIQGETQPGRDIGTAAMGALGSYFGLPGYANGGRVMTGGTPVASTPSSTVPGISMTGSTPVYRDSHTIYDQPMAPPKSGMMTNPTLDGQTGTPQAIDQAHTPVGAVSFTDPTGFATPAATAGTPAGSGGALSDAQVQQILKDRPDIAAEYQRASSTADRNSPSFTREGLDSLPNYVNYWYNNLRPQAGDNYQLPPTPQAQPSSGVPTPKATDASGAPPGYTDPTAPNGYTIGPRPDAGQQPAFYQNPNRPDYAPLDVSSAAYQRSPGFQFQMDQAKKTLDNMSSASGGVFSGNRLIGAMGYATGLANQDYNNWRDYTTNEYNVDRNRADNIYNTDRAFNYGLTQDQIQQYNLNRARADGLYSEDRSYDANRSDTRTSQLMQLAGFGQGAVSQSASAAQNFANNESSMIVAGGNARANAAINSANAWSAGANSIAGIGGNLAGMYAMTRGGGGGYSPSGYYDYTDPVMGVI